MSLSPSFGALSQVESPKSQKGSAYLFGGWASIRLPSKSAFTKDFYGRDQSSSKRRSGRSYGRDSEKRFLKLSRSSSFYILLKNHESLQCRNGCRNGSAYLFDIFQSEESHHHASLSQDKKLEKE